MQVLVVEDDAGIGESLVELLELEGYAVRWAKDGIEGLALMHQRRPDLILLDLKMPRMDGFQFRAVQRSEPEFGGIPVIILSAHANAEDVEAAAFVQKPFDIPHLLAEVERHCVS